MITNQPIDIDMVALGEDAANYQGFGYEPFAAFMAGLVVGFDREPDLHWIDCQIEKLAEDPTDTGGFALDLLIKLGEAAKAAKAAK